MNDKAQKIRKKLIKAAQEKDAAFRNAVIKIWDWFLDNLDSQLSSGDMYSGTDPDIYYTVIKFDRYKNEVKDIVNNTLDITQIIEELQHYSDNPLSQLLNTLQSYVCSEPGYTAEKLSVEDSLGFIIRISLFYKDGENVVD